MLKIEGNALRMLFGGQTLYQPKPKAAVSEGFTYEGENNKYILMVYKIEGSKGLPLAQKTFLEKILGAVQLTFNDIAILNTAASAPKFAELKGFFAPSSLFLWGVNPADLGIKADKYQITLIDKVKVVFVDSLAEVEANPELKKQLWALLKTLYL